MLSLLLVSFPLAISSFTIAQGGGSVDVVYRNQGAAIGFGTAVSHAGDVNGDGIPDYMGSNPVGEIFGYVDVFSGADGQLLHHILGHSSNSDFGVSIDCAGDLDGDGFDDILIGDPGITLLGPMGSARIYSGATGALLLQVDSSQQVDFFGASVAGLGDVNGDGVVDFLVSAPRYSLPGLSFLGAVYVYSGATGTILYEYFGSVSGVHLGSSISSAGDLNGDGTVDFFIGKLEPYPAIQPGEMMAYSGATGSLLFSIAGRAGLGSSIASGKDLDHDGVPDFVVGSPELYCGTSGSCGSLSAYSGATQTLLFQIDGTKSNERVGGVLALIEDLDGDEAADLLVGVPSLRFNGKAHSGAVRIISGETGTLLGEVHGATTGMNKGAAVSALGDLDGDGRSEFLNGDRGRAQFPAGRKGQAQVFTFDPFMVPSAKTISHSTGGTIHFQIDFPQTESGFFYAILASRRGLGPTPFRGIEVPLTRDSLFHLAVSQGLPSIVGNATGILDSNGTATASFTVPFGMPAALLGTTRWFAALSVHPTRQYAREVSVAIPVTIVP